MHAAIIMDGNGRWAQARGLPRVAGHRAGAETLRRIIEASPSAGIRTLTLYAFSSDNWSRPAGEVSALMSLLARYLKREASRCVETGTRVSLIGRRDRLPKSLLPLIDETEGVTRDGRRLHLRLAIDYSSRDQILEAARSTRPLTRESLSKRLGPDVDLVIRTSGEQRLSDFLLWECAYAEMYFTSTLWPDFDEAELRAAVADFHRRDRRFGAVPTEAAG
ncbi:MAG: di-trans,poly-cis-decaprenylcistransferase [Bryobacteraceae bacterium]